MKTIVSLIAFLVLSNSVHAQRQRPAPRQADPPLLMPDEKQAVEKESAAFEKAIEPAIAAAAKSTVRVWSGARRVAYGTVVGDGTKILSKWSEIARSNGSLRVDVAGDEYRTVKVVGVYPEDDLILLEVEGKPLTPVKWNFETPKLGAFLAAPQPGGKLAAFGVVSVLERNLKATDLAYLGVRADPTFDGQGVKVGVVEPGTGAFAAGLEPGSIILKVGDQRLSGLLALKNALAGVAPGDSVPFLVETAGTAKIVDVTLGHRPKLPQFSGGRLQQMEHMGGDISQVRDGFTRAIQTDMRPRPNQIGGPVVNLKGEVVGITVARADRTRSFIMPAAAVVDLLKRPVGDPAVAQVRKEEEEMPAAATARAIPRQRQSRAGSEARMRRQLEYLQRLTDQMNQEMNGIEGR